MKSHLLRHYFSFQHAWDGIKEAAFNHPNFKVHFGLSLLAIFGGLYFNFTHIEYSILIFTIVLGFVAEMINTSIEAMTDLITKEWRIEAKIAKDVAAGMMLVVSLGALMVAGVLFVPHIISAFS